MMNPLFTELRPAILATLVLGGITCGAYPLLITQVANATFHDQAHGSLITGKDGQIIGSALLSQNFTAENYFHPRPSAAGSGHDAASSSGSNLGPTSQKLHDALKERIAAYRTLNGLTTDAAVPADAVTASGSGLDPHISVKNAELQAARVAKARNLSIEKVKELIIANTTKPDLGILGDAGVNVLELNLALDNVERVFQLVPSK
ncbi:potassium-transporting ATPase KdpC subunit [Brevifollis gellanilyticus]|uniref:Potassium-transporting ATPase KdpC subunit n=2 Tax=Brevifollis gellanilyticus TaxID=748831 RepID=A0A512M5X1_9BACT|nr:K(+)-transporting ATPase subunit C [Brevifollis gellanilyticus]GEP42132.1 potassium-transporting ATPase KdpC subunit [Brevifollis gellanilyticus]